MILNYYGEGGFRLQSGDLSLLVDPTNNRLKGDVVLRTSVPADFEAGQGEVGFPGEYEIKEIEITGWQVPGESTEKLIKTVYLVKWDGMMFAFLGKINKIPPTEILGNFDGALSILFLPVGDKEVLSSDDALQITKQLEPNLVIPSCFKDVKDFLKVIRQEEKWQDKLVFKSKDLEGRKNEVILLKVSGANG